MITRDLYTQDTFTLGESVSLAFWPVQAVYTVTAIDDQFYYLKRPVGNTVYTLKAKGQCMRKVAL